MKVTHSIINGGNTKEPGLESQIPVGDHIIFVATIVCSHINTESKKRLYTIGPGHKLGSVS